MPEEYHQQHGLALTDDALAIQGESWTAISEAGQIEPGEEVIITRVDGLKLWVTKKG